MTYNDAAEFSHSPSYQCVALAAWPPNGCDSVKSRRVGTACGAYVTKGHCYSRRVRCDMLAGCPIHATTHGHAWALYLDAPRTGESSPPAQHPLPSAAPRRHLRPRHHPRRRPGRDLRWVTLASVPTIANAALRRRRLPQAAYDPASALQEKARAFHAYHLAAGPPARMAPRRPATCIIQVRNHVAAQQVVI